MTNSDKNTVPKVKRPRSLAFKIFLYLAAFTLFILLVLWLFQTVLMDEIYQKIKLSDMKSCAEEVSESVSSGDMKDCVLSASGEYNCCISVYEIREGSGDIVASSHRQTTCMVHNLSSNGFLGEMYKGAKEDQFYIKRIGLELGDEDAQIMSGGTKEKSPSAVICATIVEKGRADYLVLVDSEILPLVATTRAIKYQLIFISAVLFVTALFLSVLISSKIAKPFKKMTKEAACLAEGRYDVNFETHSFSEAVELGEALNYAAGELSKLDVMQKELIANISHDLRTPLTMITGYSEVMRDIPGEMTPENIQIVIDETGRLSTLVSDLLELSRLTSGSQVMHAERFNITETVRETLSRYSHLKEAEGYQFVFNTETDVFVSADKVRILQVLYNLINNAVNYTGEDKTVTVSQSIENGAVRISVSDTGAGIPKEQLPMIWERYYKVGGFHNRGKVGTGLGLSIVKNILLMHNAHFGVTSTLGVGSTFWFELPITE